MLIKEFSKYWAMETSQARRHGRVALALTLALVLALLVGLPMVAVGQGGDSASPTADSPAPASVDPAVSAANGTIDVVIVFEPPPLASVAAASDPVDLLTASADRQFVAIEALAAADDAIDITSTSWLAHAVYLTVDTNETPVSVIAEVPGVVAVEEPAGAELVHPVGSPNATTVASASSAATTGLELLNVTGAWEAFDTRGDGVSVAVLDTGVDADHPDIDVDAWRDFHPTDPSPDPKDYGSHGTHVAGTVAGGDDSGTHIGVAPNVSLHVGAVLTDEGGTGTVSQVVDGMEWAVESEVDVISLSLGGEGISHSYVQATLNAHAAGTAVVAASGNDGPDTALTPGNVFDLLSVGAVDADGEVAAFSSGKEIVTDDVWGLLAPNHWPDTYLVPDVTAHGVDVLSTMPGGTYGVMSGTSASTPHVAGVIALAQSATADELRPAQLYEAVIDTAVHPHGDEQDTRHGHGVVDAVAAVEFVTSIGAIEGVVTDETTGEAIGGATVTVAGPDGELTTTTDADGTYRVVGLDVDAAYNVTAEHEGYITESATNVAVSGGSVTTVDLALVETASIAGSIVDAQTGIALDEVTIAIEAADGTTATVQADDSGDFLVDGLDPRLSYEVRAEREGYRASTESDISLDPGGGSWVSLELAGDGAIEVAIDDATFATPVDDAVVTATGPFGSYTGEHTGDGTYLVENVPSLGTYAVDVEASGFETATTDLSITGSNESATDSLSLVGTAELTVSLADDATGTGLDEVPVRVERVDGTGEAVVVVTNPQGEATITVPGRPTDVTADADPDGYDSTTGSTIAGADPVTTLNLEATGDASITVELEDDTFGGSITDADVVAVGPNGVYHAEVNDDGSYRIRGVPSLGEHEVRATATGYHNATSTVEVADGQPVGPFTLHLGGDATLVITVTDGDGDSIDEPNITVTNARDASIDLEGSTVEDGTIEVVVPGDGTAYEVTASADGYESTSTTSGTVGAGETVSVGVELAPADSIPGFGMAVVAVGFLVLIGLALLRWRQ